MPFLYFPMVFFVFLCFPMVSYGRLWLFYGFPFGFLGFPMNLAMVYYGLPNVSYVFVLFPVVSIDAHIVFQ